MKKIIKPYPMTGRLIVTRGYVFFFIDRYDCLHCTFFLHIFTCRVKVFRTHNASGDCTGRYKFNYRPYNHDNNGPLHPI